MEEHHKNILKWIELVSLEGSVHVDAYERSYLNDGVRVPQVDGK